MANSLLIVGEYVIHLDRMIRAEAETSTVSARIYFDDGSIVSLTSKEWDEFIRKINERSN